MNARPWKILIRAGDRLLHVDVVDSAGNTLNQSAIDAKLFQSMEILIDPKNTNITFSTSSGGVFPTSES